MPLRRVPGPSHHTPDPIDFGDLPGRESIGTLVEGVPAATWAYPEAPPETVMPLWLESSVLVAADPILDPSNPTGGPLLLLDLLRPDSTHASSATRLTSGFNRTYTEEFFLARPSASGLFRVGYGDAKTDGRFGSGYFRQFSENLLARYDRGTRWGGWRVGWQRSSVRVRPDRTQRFLQDRTGWESGAVVRAGGWVTDLSAAVSWERLAHEGDPEAKRKDALSRGLVRLRGPGQRLRPLASLEWNHDRLRFYRPGVSFHSEDVETDGPGVAAGVEGASRFGRYRGSAGWARVGPDRAGWTAAATCEGTLRSAWGWSVHADHLPRVPLIPRLAGDLSTLVGQGLFVAGSSPAGGGVLADDDSPTEQWTRVEVEARQADELDDVPLLAIRARWIELRHALVTTEEEFALLRPDRFAELPAAARDRTLRVGALHLEAGRALPAGFRLQVWAAARTSHPGWESQPWMTPFDARARVSCRRLLFRGDLDAEGYVRGDWSARRAAPAGERPAAGRYDAGLIGRIGDLTLFVDLMNVTSAEVSSADYLAESAEWVPLPLRSYRMGMTWRFRD